MLGGLIEVGFEIQISRQGEQCQSLGNVADEAMIMVEVTSAAAALPSLKRSAQNPTWCQYIIDS